jgi:hypothetical protein
MESKVSGPLVEECFWGQTDRLEEDREASGGWLTWKGVISKGKLTGEEATQSGWERAMYRLKQGSIECKELLYSFEELSEHLDRCAHAYKSIAEEQHDRKGFGSEFPQSTLKKGWCQMRDLIAEIGKSHLKASIDMKNLVYNPLDRFLEDFEKIIRDHGVHLVELESKLHYWTKEVETSRAEYEFRSSEADRDDIAHEKRARTGIESSSGLDSDQSTVIILNDLSSRDSERADDKTEEKRDDFFVELGPLKLSRSRVHELLMQMQHPVNGITIEDLRGTLLGTHHYVINGRDAGTWFLGHVEEVKDDQKAALFGEFLLEKGFLSPLHGSVLEFQLSSSAYYEWKLLVTENHDGFCSSFYSPLVFGKSRSVAAKADAHYKCAVRLAERARLAYEKGVFEFLREFRSLEMNRIALIRNLLQLLANILSKVTHPLEKHHEDRIKIMDICSEQHDFSWIVSDYRTGWQRPSVFVYTSRYHHPAKGR